MNENKLAQRRKGWNDGMALLKGKCSGFTFHMLGQSPMSSITSNMTSGKCLLLNCMKWFLSMVSNNDLQTSTQNRWKMHLQCIWGPGIYHSLISTLREVMISVHDKHQLKHVIKYVCSIMNLKFLRYFAITHTDLVS